jgi:hypothetical protein
MTRRFVLLTILIALSVVPVGSAAAVERQSGTWAGQVVAHERHYDYEGSPCPVEAEQCIMIVVRYRIVAVTDQAREALPRVAGGAARLTGTLDSRSNGEHAGTLYVRRVRPA